MALGIKVEDGIYTVLSVPLDWESNHILANHFRMLAEEIERSDINILEARLVAPLNQPVDKTSLQFVGLPPRK